MPNLFLTGLLDFNISIEQLFSFVKRKKSSSNIVLKKNPSKLSSSTINTLPNLIATKQC